MQANTIKGKKEKQQIMFSLNLNLINKTQP